MAAIPRGGRDGRETMDNFLPNLVAALILVILLNLLNSNRGVLEGQNEERFRVVAFHFLNGDFARLHTLPIVLYSKRKQLVRSGDKL